MFAALRKDQIIIVAPGESHFMNAIRSQLQNSITCPPTQGLIASCHHVPNIKSTSRTPPARLDNDILASTVITLPIPRTETIGDHSRTSLIPNNLRIGFTGERVGGGIIWLQSSFQSIRNCVLRKSYIRSRISHFEMLCCMKHSGGQ